jgi:hypothetical protein
MRRFAIDCSEHEPRTIGENWYTLSPNRRYRSVVKATVTGPEKARSGMPLAWPLSSGCPESSDWI